jgi:hypothetical protein
VRRSCVVLMVIAMSVLGLGITASPGHAEPAPPTSDPAGKLLYPESSFYPRLIRLQHSKDANGTIVASVNTLEQTGVFLASTDGGKTFQQRGTIVDPITANVTVARNLCCSTLMELPLAVGVFPAGTLLWADTTHYSVLDVYRHIEQRLWASTDHGYTWQYVSSIESADTVYSLIGFGSRLPCAWEPSLSVAADGQLVAFYSDETDSLHHSQKLVQVRSPDAVHWVNQTDTVVSDVGDVRPGMANVIQLPDGTYFMTYEICNSDMIHPCLAYSRRSADGWNYGDPRFFGTQIRTTDGDGYTQHTPYPAWSPGPGPRGTILLSGQMMSNVDGQMTPDTGRTVLANDELGNGQWYKIPAPIPINDVVDDICKNYSSPLLPSPDGRSVMEAATDLDSAGVCRSYYATAPLAPHADAGTHYGRETTGSSR